MSKSGSGRGRSADPTGRSRGLRTRVKTARGRKISSTRWLERQLNDPYVIEAQRLGYRSRAAFKLAEIDQQEAILRGAGAVVDLGAAPGGWTQVITERHPGARIVAVDVREMEPLPGVEFLLLDFLDELAEEEISAVLGGKADVVLSDMAASATGHRKTDHLRTLALAEAAFEFAVKVLSPGGRFVCKVLQGGAEHQLLARIKQAFGRVKHVKPPSSRADSSEQYLVASKFRPKSPN